MQNNDKNVYILGAGFSKELGLPLQEDFLLVAKEVYFRDPEKYKHFQSVFNYQDSLSKMKNVLSYPLFNLEHLFNLLEMDIYYSEQDSRKKSDREMLKAAFLNLVTDVLIELTINPFYHDRDGALGFKEEYSNYLKFLELFIKEDKGTFINIHQDTVISFNYDLVFEATTSLFNWNQLEGGTGLQDENKIIKLNTKFGKENIEIKALSQYFLGNIPEMIFKSKHIFSETTERAIKLIKLHGSINWQESSNNSESFIIPPTWNKSDERISQLWSLAYNELKEAKRIIIIGYSFPETDVYVKSLLALALNENKILHNIYFINPDKENVKSRCLDLLDKHFVKHCDYKEWTFSDFINSDDGKNFIKEKLNRDVEKRQVRSCLI